MALHSKWSSGDLIFYDGTQDIFRIKNGTDGLELGYDDYGVPFKFYGATASAFMNWNSTGDKLEFDLADIAMGDTDYIIFGDGSDFTLACTTGNILELLPATSGSDMNLGSATKPLDVVNYGNITYRDPNTASTTGVLTLTTASNRVQFLAPTTGAPLAGKLVLPSATGSAGVEFKIFNTTTGGITVYDASTTGTTILALSRLEGAMIISDGTNWKGMVGTS